MSDVVYVGIRLPKTLLERIERYEEQQEAKNPGLELSRTDAVKMLLTQALNLVEQEPPAPVQKKAPEASSPKKQAKPPTSPHRTKKERA